MQPPNAIREAIAKNGTTLSHDTAQVFRQLYAQHHQESGASKYRAILKNNISYGPHERNVLDVYVPQDTSTHSTHPGLVTGDKDLYANIGTQLFCFSWNGSGDHQLPSRAQRHLSRWKRGHPNYREWIYNNIHKPEYGNGAPEKVVFIGHSAGGMHLATNIYYVAGDALTPLVPPLAGVVYISVPFSYDTSPKNRKGPESIQDAVFQFVDSYRARSPRGILPELAIIPEHNHISNVSSIGTEDDVQGRLLREFIFKDDS
ncbi:hypothetical protein BDP27DRAFT_1372058 [Rhodocollybia butyracea]|uniref:Uncharacterized protein n=1 Tax=Rhodocollybia butyracea TaxID=206335 RepID=A0A9P5P9A4_9AGAR|nr:hypothetical protein BDP27DRAFT_1372058 [Rhodocollybia butyracea]